MTDPPTDYAEVNPAKLAQQCRKGADEPRPQPPTSQAPSP
jgi:hypothetical protein